MSIVYLQMKSTQNKLRKVNDPYLVYRNEVAGWEWRILKRYQSPEGEAKNEFSRWFCAVKSPMTSPGYDMGDVYVSEVVSNGVKVENPVLEKW